MSLKHPLTLGALALLAVSATPVQAQAPSAMLAVRQCDITPTEGPALRAAFSEFVEYATANTPDLPGNVYGSFRQQFWGGAHFTTIYEVASLAEYEEMVQARGRVMQNDPRWRELWRAWNSHLVPQSCEVTFHQRWPSGQ